MTLKLFIGKDTRFPPETFGYIFFAGKEKETGWGFLLEGDQRPLFETE